jgi:hypothetical protein
MAQTNGYDRHSADFKALCTCRFIANASVNIRISYRKVGLRHNPGKHGLNVLLGKRASLHVDTGFLKVKRLEKWKTHEVVPMRMGKDDIIAEASLFDQPVPEPSNTGTRIHNNDAIIFGPDFNACNGPP